MFFFLLLLDSIYFYMYVWMDVCTSGWTYKDENQRNDKIERKQNEIKKVYLDEINKVNSMKFNEMKIENGMG